MQVCCLGIYLISLAISFGRSSERLSSSIFVGKEPAEELADIDLHGIAAIERRIVMVVVSTEHKMHVCMCVCVFLTGKIVGRNGL